MFSVFGGVGQAGVLEDRVLGPLTQPDIGIDRGDLVDEEEEEDHESVEEAQGAAVGYEHSHFHLQQNVNTA